MKVAGLFSGIGGVELGLRKAGHEICFLNEIWDPAQAVLAKHFPETELTGDVGTLRSLPQEVELLVGGFPCQDLSQAGRTNGITGSQSSLIHHVFRLIDLQSPNWVLLENVPFMLQLDRGKAMSLLADEIEARGYRWAYRVVNTLAFLPQRRERVFLLATRTDVDPADVLLVDDVTPNLSETNLKRHAHGFYWTEGLRGLGWTVDAIPTLKKGSTLGIPSAPAILRPDGTVTTPDIRDAERLQGFDEYWTDPAEEVGRSSLRWALVGNSVSVPISRWIGTRLIEPGRFDNGRDQEINQDKAWPRAARFDGSQRHSVQIGAYPKWKPRPPLDSFLLHPGRPLSVRATSGFLSRATRAQLRFAEGFLGALRMHLDTQILREANELRQASR